MKKIILSLLFGCVLVVQTGNAAEMSNNAIISYVGSYTEYGNGDVVVRLDNTTGKTCVGYWMNQNDPGFNATMSMVLAAYQTGTVVAIRGEEDRLWSGHPDPYCYLFAIHYR